MYVCARTYFCTQDNTPELAETFWVNLTDVRLVNESSRLGSSTASPRLAQPGNEIATVTIAENDESRGILNFVVNKVRVQARR